MELWLVRHAKAEPRGGAYPDDRLRPLSAAGGRQASGLAEAARRLGVQLDRLFSSPWIRAAQTAEPLRGVLRSGRSVEYLDALTQGDPEALVVSLRELLAPADRSAACVGHEPQLSVAASLLLTGRADGLALALRTSGVVLLEGDVRAGEMALRAFAPPSLTGEAGRPG